MFESSLVFDCNNIDLSFSLIPEHLNANRFEYIETAMGC